ncbi:MAG TPA: SDR family NAD(P)-dependent oxidoreductase [Chloroflexota bacterium]|nr:SDR family NAD(P)-dependent oxidoreductase [Chloroflexota bacterium]
MELGLAGKVALITGAGGGIGREAARLLGAEGAHVVAADVRLEAALATAGAVSATASGVRALALALDVTSEASVAQVVSEATRTLGPLDVVVNCAGIYRVGTLDTVTPAAWDELLEVNLRGTFLVCRAVLPGMVERGRGSIVNLSSISGRTRSTLAAPSYVASKAGVIGLTMSLASQVAAHGVRVNAIAPGPVDTDMIRTLDPALQDRLVTTIPLGRLGTAAEVARAIVFLASEAASFITGETLNVNGGAFMV